MNNKNKQILAILGVILGCMLFYFLMMWILPFSILWTVMGHRRIFILIIFSHILIGLCVWAGWGINYLENYNTKERSEPNHKL